MITIVAGEAAAIITARAYAKYSNNNKNNNFLFKLRIYHLYTNIESQTSLSKVA